MLNRVGIVVCIYLGTCLLVAREASAQLYAQTLGQIYAESDHVVLAERLGAAEGDNTFQFRVTESLKQQGELETPAEESPSASLWGENSRLIAKLGRSGECYVIFGRNVRDRIVWSQAWGIQRSSLKDVEEAMHGSKQGVERLLSFAPFLTSKEPLLARNAQLEFIAAADGDFEQLNDQNLDREQILLRIKQVLPQLAKGDSQENRNSRSFLLLERRLLFDLLARCGTKSDADWVEQQLLEVKNAESQHVSHDMIVCYLQLKGSSGLSLVEREFLDDNSSFRNSYELILALRYFIAHASHSISRKEIVGVLRKVLEEPTLADLVIMDLARLEDWGSIDTLIALASDASKQNWCRLPVVNFLRICPTEQAREELRRLSEVDSELLKRANFFFTDSMIANGEWKELDMRIRPEFPGRNRWGC